MELSLDHGRSALRGRVASAWARVGPAELAVSLVCAFTAIFAVVGGDIRWLGALGRAIVATHGVPRGVPFASAPSDAWPNVPVLAELIVHGLTASLNDRGLLLAQLVAVGVGLTFLVVDARREGATGSGAGTAVLLVVLGGSSAFVVIRVQLFSLLMLPIVLALLHAESRRPSRRIWLLPVLLALWSNLHGVVLVGLGVSAIYLVLARARARPGESAAVLVASLFAMCLTPALERTPAYYARYFHQEGVRRAQDFWAPLSLSNTVDLVLIGAAIVLVALALRARPRAWELVSLTALTALTVHGARSGIWLLMFAAVPAARAIRPRLGARPWALLTITAVALVGYGVVQGPKNTGAGPRLLAETVREAEGTPVLAEGLLAEQVAQAGGRVWVGNPLEAFSLRDQRLYVDWLHAGPGGAAALAHAPRAVLVLRWGSSKRLVENASGFRLVDEDPGALLYVRR